MIDTNELRRLAQEATSGEWYVVRGNHIYGRKKVTDGEEEWHPLIACTDDDEVNVSFEVNAAFIAAANPATIEEILDRLEAAEKARDYAKAAAENIALKLDYLRSKLETAENAQNDWLRANAPGGWIDNLRIENEALRAKIEQMERQEPVAWTTKLALEYGASRLGFQVSDVNMWGENGVPLYALPGAQTQGEEK